MRHPIFLGGFVQAEETLDRVPDGAGGRLDAAGNQIAQGDLHAAKLPSGPLRGLSGLFCRVGQIVHVTIRLGERGLHLVQIRGGVVHRLGPAQGFRVILTVLVRSGVQALAQLGELLLLGLNLAVEDLALGPQGRLAPVPCLKGGGHRLHLAA